MGKFPALSAVIFRCVGRRRRGGPTCFVKSKHNGRPAARANRARRPERALFGAVAGATRMGQEFGLRKERGRSVPRVECALSGGVPILEDELRSLEIMLGESLRQLLSGGPKAPKAGGSPMPRPHPRSAT